MKKALLLTSLVASFLMFGVQPSFAQSPTPAGSTDSAEIRRLIRERIEQTLQEKTTESEFIAVLGNILKVGTSTFTLLDSRGRERTVEMADNSAIISGKKTVTLKDLSINSGVVAYGRAEDEVVVNAIRIELSDSDFVETRRVFLGTITKWDRRFLTLQVRGSNTQETWNVNAQTKYEDNLGTAIKATDIQTDQAALVVARQLDGTRVAVKIRLLAPLAR